MDPTLASESRVGAELLQKSGYVPATPSKVLVLGPRVPVPSPEAKTVKSVGSLTFKVRLDIRCSGARRLTPPKLLHTPADAQCGRLDSSTLSTNHRVALAPRFAIAPH